MGRQILLKGFWERFSLYKGRDIGRGHPLLFHTLCGPAMMPELQQPFCYRSEAKPEIELGGRARTLKVGANLSLGF